MPRRRRSSRVPACVRCGNEDDLLTLSDGNLYCTPCTRCTHVSSDLDVCPACLRQLYTIRTFTGLHLIHVPLYVYEVWRDYRLEPGYLLTWDWNEEEALTAAAEAWRRAPWRLAPPPSAPADQLPAHLRARFT